MQIFKTIFHYARVSDPNQVAGMGLDRQLGDMRTYCAKEGIDAPNTLIITDEGLSGFHGDHRTFGDFGRFETDALLGIHDGCIFICENLDRFSRQGFEKGLASVTSLIGNGVTVHTLDGDRFPARQPITFAQWMMASMKLEVAQIESEKKSKRTHDNWKLKRIKARKAGTVLTKAVEPWLRIGDDMKAYAVHARAAQVLDWFHMADSGMGAYSICREMERRGVPTWDRYNGREAKCWQRTFIGKTLSNRAVIGEYQPMTTMRQNGRKVRVNEGEAWEGHFPAIVPLDLFNRVQANASARKAAKGANITKQSSERIGNLFSGLLKCECCGGSLHYKTGHREGTTFTGWSGKTYTCHKDSGSLVCQTANVSGGRRCSNRAHWAYLTFETAMVKALLHLAMDDDAFANRGEIGRLTTTIAERERTLELAKAKATRLWSAWADSASDNAKALALATDADCQKLAVNLAALTKQHEEASGRTTSAEHIRRVGDIAANLYCDDFSKRVEIRRKVMLAMHGLVERVVFTPDKASVFLKGNAGLLIVNRRGETYGYDLIKDGREHVGELQRYLQRRQRAKSEGNFFDNVSRVL